MNFCIIEEYDEKIQKMNHHCLYINNLNAFLSIKSNKSNRTTYPCETCTSIFY